MRFMMMTTEDSSSASTPPSPELYAEMGKLIEEMTKAGVRQLLGLRSWKPNRRKKRSNSRNDSGRWSVMAKAAFIRCSVLRMDLQDSDRSYES